MRSARLPIVHASVATSCQYWQGCPQVNKFEQVSSLSHSPRWKSLSRSSVLGHQMSLTGGQGGIDLCTLKSHVHRRIHGWLSPMHHGYMGTHGQT